MTPESKRKPTGEGVVSAVVEQALPSAIYRVRLEDGTKVLAHVGERRGANFLRLLPGQAVRVRLSRHDAGRGRIVERERD